MIALQKSLPGRQFTGKNPPRPAAARAGRILPVNCRPKETFLGGDPIMGHRRSQGLHGLSAFLTDGTQFITVTRTLLLRFQTRRRPNIVVASTITQL